MSPERDFGSQKPAEESVFDRRLLNMEKDNQEVFKLLPEAVRESSLGEAFKEIQNELSSETTNMDLIYFNGFLRRFAHYCKDSASIDRTVDTFIVSALVNGGQGALVVPDDVYFGEGMTFVSDFENYQKEKKEYGDDNSGNYKILRHSLSEVGIHIIQNVFREKLAGKVSLDRDARYKEGATVASADDSIHSLFQTIHFQDAYMEEVQKLTRE